MTALTQESLKEILDYDPETGLFLWLKSTGPRAIIGTRAGTPHNKGYWFIRILGETHLAHRLAFLWMTGAFPENDVDHANMDRSDNRWANLRAATRSQNRANTKIRADNASGYKGVCWNPKTRKWRAQTMKDGRRLYLGEYPSKEAAYQKYTEAFCENFKEFARI